MIIALQYWTGDEAEALTLARLLADIEPERRDDVLLVLARAFDCDLSAEAARTRDYCAAKMPTMLLQSAVERVGHPDGCFGVWSGTVSRLYELWNRGLIQWGHSSVATFEADGCPVRPDWIGRLTKAHEFSLGRGYRVTGALMDEPIPHTNGNLCMHLSVWGDFPSLCECPANVAWDLHHATVLMPLTRHCNAIRNEYETRNWTEGCLAGIARETAWVANVKDDSIQRIVRGWMKTPAWKDRKDDR